MSAVSIEPSSSTSCNTKPLFSNTASPCTFIKRTQPTRFTNSWISNKNLLVNFCYMFRPSRPSSEIPFPRIFDPRNLYRVDCVTWHNVYCLSSAEVVKRQIRYGRKWPWSVCKTCVKLSERTVGHVLNFAGYLECRRTRSCVFLTF